MKKPHIIVLVVLAAVVSMGAWLLLKDETSALNASDAETEFIAGSGPLDGMTFSGALGPESSPKDTPDTFVFANGTFVSKECELRCKYPARPYFIRKTGARTEFVSESKCPYKDAKIVWRGAVEGNTITGISTWVVKRWYWTVENRFEFSGELVPSSTAPTGTQ